jgi:hypothetical protein
MTFVKGKSGNPNGRPRKTKTLADILEKLGSATGAGDVSRKERLMEIVYQMAEGGDLAAIKFIAERTDGKPIETLRTQEIERDEVIDI